MQKTSNALYACMRAVREVLERTKVAIRKEGHHIERLLDNMLQSKQLKMNYYMLICVIIC